MDVIKTGVMWFFLAKISNDASLLILTNLFEPFLDLQTKHCLCELYALGISIVSLVVVELKLILFDITLEELLVEHTEKSSLFVVAAYLVLNQYSAFLLQFLWI